MFSENMGNLKLSQLPYFLSDFHNFCTILFGFFLYFFLNYVIFGPDFIFKEWDC